MKNDLFVPLGELLEEDDEEIKKLKSLKQREEEYAFLLGPIEHAIAEYYVSHKSLKDKDVVAILKNLRTNYSSPIEAFKHPLEKSVIMELSNTLQKMPAMHRELYLSFSYILWTIDNRSWLESSRAYLDWILNFFGMMGKEEKKKFLEEYGRIAKKHGISKEKIDACIGDAPDENSWLPDKEMEQASLKESEQFAMSDDELCEHFLASKEKEDGLFALEELLRQIDGHMVNSAFEKAISLIKRILPGRMEPGIREVLCSMRIECLICLGRFPEAEEQIKSLIELNPSYPMPYFHRALISYKNNDLPEALRHCDLSINVAEKMNMRHPQYYLMK
ncbi:hypothetical protein HYU13_06475, partial [Candidatus Woesearchaeota archaeon]|nr:hypothetical protein [Candidatus Woesearchaeota archaeon]